MALNDIKLGALASEVLLTPFERTLSEGFADLTRDAQTASGRNVRDIIAVKRFWTLEWQYITEENLAAIRGLYDLKTELSLLITRPNFTVSSYTVLIKPFSWKRARGFGMRYWEGVTLDIVEV